MVSPPFFNLLDLSVSHNLTKTSFVVESIKQSVAQKVVNFNMKKYDYDYLLLFSLPSCPQCKGLKMSLKETGLEYEESKEYDEYNVEEVPTLILMVNKKGHIHAEAKRHVGYMTPQELNEFVRGTSCTRWIRVETDIKD